MAASLDGFIADADGGYAWIPDEPDFDFTELLAQFDTLLVGRRTLEEVPNVAADFPDKQVIVFSRTLRQADHPSVTIVGEGMEDVVRDLKASSGKDIWLYGGGELFRSLLTLGLVDTVEPAVMPVLLGGGRRLLPEARGPWKLVLTREQVYGKSGMVLLEYRVDYQQRV